ncbi:MAG TPA: glycoside hydrolase family 3 C-terminal domain-containing protein, partial [Phycisphaerae bacterium]
ANWTKACSAQGSVPVIKHFAANNQETNRNSVNAVVDERTMHEIYLPAFKKAVQEGGTVAVMCSYNRLNGSYASNNDWLLNQVLRTQWSFKGLVMSDWGASHSPDDILKGLDLEMPSGQNLNGNRFEQAVADGTMKDGELRTAIDLSVQRILRTAAAMGWLDAGWVSRDEKLPLDSPDSTKTALDIAREAMVLLKNAGNMLPLDRSKVKNIVVVGPNATRAMPAAPAPAAAGAAPAGGGRGRGGRGGQQRGGTSATNIGGGGSGAVTPFPAHDDEGDYYKGIEKAAGAGVKVTYLPVAAEQLTDGSEALAQIKAADAVVVCVGLNRNSEAEGRDRAFDLPAAQLALINAVGKLNAHAVVINNSGGGVGVLPWKDNAAAIIHAYYLGQEGGLAIGQMLFGDISPSGRLCSTFDARWEDNPAFAYYPGTNQAGIPTEPYTEGIFYGYRGYDKAGKEPLFPFGFGLTYTTFALTNLKVDPAGTGMTASLDVKNTGSRAAAEVVQIYVGEANPVVPRPARELKGFAKVMLNPGESKHVTVSLPAESFAYWSPAKKDWTTDTGATFTVEAAESERDVKLKQTLTR